MPLTHRVIPLFQSVHKHRLQTPHYRTVMWTNSHETVVTSYGIPWLVVTSLNTASTLATLVTGHRYICRILLLVLSGPIHYALINNWNCEMILHECNIEKTWNFTYILYGYNIERSVNLMWNFTFYMSAILRGLWNFEIF